MTDETQNAINEAYIRGRTEARAEEHAAQEMLDAINAELEDIVPSQCPTALERVRALRSIIQELEEEDRVKGEELESAREKAERMTDMRDNLRANLEATQDDLSNAVCGLIEVYNGELEAKLEAAEREKKEAIDERDAALAKVDAAGKVLEDNGCDCDCECDSDGHIDACEPCLACRIAAALGEG